MIRVKQIEVLDLKLISDLCETMLASTEIMEENLLVKETCGNDSKGYRNLL